jgi:O-antigen/teichoic acid export membrane protein
MKTKKFVLNLITDVIPLIIISILGLYKSKYFLQFLGSDTLGLYNLFSQIMIYIALVDGGLSSAVLCALYKPNTEGNTSKFNEILTAVRKVFAKIGIVIFGLAFIVSFVVPFFIKDNSFEYFYVVGAFLLFALSNVIGYFFVPYQSLLEVKEKKYYVNICLEVGQIVLSILEIILLISGVGFLWILLMHSVVKLVSNIAIYIICKKKYPDVNFKNDSEDRTFTGQVKHLIFHKVNGLIGSNIDILIITRFQGLTNVAIYSTYNYFINMLKTIMGKISGAMQAIVGNFMVRSKNKIYDLYKEINSMVFFLAIILCCPLTLALDYFIDIWYEGEIATSFAISISFVLILFLYIVKMNTNTFINSAGLFKETKKCAIVDTIVNLTLSLILVYFIGIPGVLIATVISVFISEYIMKTIVAHKYIFEKSVIKYFLSNIKFFILYIIELVVGYYIISMVSINTIVSWFAIFIVYTILNSAITLFIFYLLKEVKFINRLKLLIIKKNG